MDVFYDLRREHFKEVKKDRKMNLEEKKQILEKLKGLKDHENPIKAVDEAKPLQEEFKKAGYVPIKHKNRMWKEYREICDVIYDRFRAAKSAVDVVGRENIDNFSVDDIADIRKKQSNVNKLEKEIKKLTGELLQMKESLSYFKPSSGGSSLLDEVKQKIEKAETDLEKKEDKLAQLEKEIDLIKKDA
jgi:formyltetrahydrofolate synthetase